MSASLVGSEMCIRDRSRATNKRRAFKQNAENKRQNSHVPFSRPARWASACLLYTSDAADDM
eukprot:3111265-Alexandrium_andersonii.AAC.1